MSCEAYSTEDAAYLVRLPKVGKPRVPLLHISTSLNPGWREILVRRQHEVSWCGGVRDGT